MAGTLKALLVIVCICLTGRWQGVEGEAGVCPSTERCTKEFQEQAKVIGHNREDFCRLLKEELECFNIERASCPDPLLKDVQSKIQNAQNERRKACGASWIEVSHWLLTVSAMMAMVFIHRHQ
ncbi:uncharacterized protein LOC143295234 [Babylonia areolata]|uniref:uncharacterized protein LOC143295234 n=1 Tax=Babylonia areolata TaxID=304850 RepID=UPI003FD17FBA